MTESVSQRCQVFDDGATQREMAALLLSIQADLEYIRLFLSMHQHDGLNTPPTTTPNPLNTIP
jgi:hypothetical protein